MLHKKQTVVVTLTHTILLLDNNIICVKDSAGTRNVLNTPAGLDIIVIGYRAVKIFPEKIDSTKIESGNPFYLRMYNVSQKKATILTKRGHARYPLF